MADPPTEELLRSIDDQLDAIYGTEPLPDEAYEAPKVDHQVLVNEALKVLRYPDPESPEDRLDRRDWTDNVIMKKARQKDLPETPAGGMIEAPSPVSDNYGRLIVDPSVAEGLKEFKSKFSKALLEPDKESDEYKEWLGKYTPFERREAREIARSYFKNKDREEAKRHHKEYYQQLSDMYGPVVGDRFLGNVGAALEGSSKRSVATFSRLVQWKDKRTQKEWHEKGHEFLRDADLMDEAASEVLGTGPWGQAFRGATSSVIEASVAGTAGLPGIIGWFTLSRGSEAAYEADQAGLTGKDKTWYVVTSGGIEGGVTAAFSAIGLGGFESKIAGGVVRQSLGKVLKDLGIHGMAELTEEEIIAVGDAANRTLQGVDPTAAHPDRLGPLLADTFRTTLLAQGMAESRSWVGRYYAKNNYEEALALAGKTKLSRGDSKIVGTTGENSESQRNAILGNLVQEINRIKAGEPEVEPDLGPTRDEVTGTEAPAAHPGPPDPALSPEQVQVQQEIADKRAAEPSVEQVESGTVVNVWVPDPSKPRTGTSNQGRVVEQRGDTLVVELPDGSIHERPVSEGRYDFESGVSSGEALGRTVNSGKAGALRQNVGKEAGDRYESDYRAAQDEEVARRLDAKVARPTPLPEAPTETAPAPVEATPPVAAESPVKVARYTHADGKGILDNSGLDLSKLNDDEDQELLELRSYGLQQPLEVPPNGVFFFTEEGEKKNSRLLELLEKASIKGVVRTESSYSGTPVWESGDGQVALDPSQIVDDVSTPAPAAPAPAEAAPLEAEPEQAVQHDNEGTTVSVPVARVDELKAQGQSEAVAESQAAAEQDVPIDTSGMPKWQKALYEAGRGNTIVTNDQLGGILDEINQAVKDVAKGHTPGSIFPITDKMVRATTKLLVYMAEAAAKSSVRLTKKKIIEFLRQYPPFNLRDPRKKKAKRKSRWLITDAEISKMLDLPVTLEYVVTFEDGSQRIVMADSEGEAAAKTQAWQQEQIPGWIDLAAQIDPTLPEAAQRHQAIKSVKAAPARSIMERMKQIWNRAIDLPSRRVVVNQQIRWTEGETVEMSARKLLKISLGRQRRAARAGYTAAVVNEGMTWQDILSSAQQLPDGVEKRNVLKILQRLARARVGTPRGKVAMEKAVKALNTLHEKYEHAAALSELRALEASVAKSNIDPKYKKEIEEILSGLRLTNHTQKTIDRMKSLLEAAAEDGVGQIPQPLIDKANDVLAKYDDGVTPATEMSAADLRAVTKKIQSMLHQMALKRVITVRGLEEDRVQVEELGADEITERSNKARGVKVGTGRARKKMNWFKRLLWFDQASVDTLAYLLGGKDSVFYELMSTQLRRARDKFASIQNAGLVHIRGALAAAGISPKAFGSMSRIGGENVVQTVIELPTARSSKSGARVESLTLTVGEKIGLFLHLQDRYTRAEILADDSNGIFISSQDREKGDSVRLTIEDVVAVEQSMSPQELQIAAALSEYISKTMGEKVNEEWLRQFGYELQMHENYWPRTRDSEQRESSPENIMQEFLNDSLAHIPIFKSRSTSTAAISISDAFGVYFSHINRAGSFVSMHGAITDALSMLHSTPVQNALRNTQEHHDTWTSQIEKTIADFRGLAKKQSDAAMEEGLRKLINNSHIAALGLKPHIALYQVASFITAATKLGAMKMVAGLKGLSSETLGEIMEWSGTLAQRITSGGQQIMSPDYTGNVALEFFGGVENRSYGRMKRKVDQVAMWMIKKMDQVVIQSIWQAAKNEGIEQGLEGDELMAFTRDRAVDVVDMTQPTWDPLTTSTMGMVGRSSPSLKMLATMFSSQRNKNFNITLKAYSDFMASEDKWKAAAPFLGTLATVNAAQSAVVYGMGTGVQYALAAMWGDDEEMEEVEGMGYGDHSIEVLRKAMGNWLIFGDAINVVAGSVLEDKKQMSPGFRRVRGTILSGVALDGIASAAGFSKAFQQYMDDERSAQWPSKGESKASDTLSEAVDKFIRSAGMAGGFPTGGLMQLFGRAMPHRGKKRWAYEPTNQLHELDREWGRSSPASIERKLKLKPGDLLLQEQLVAAKRTRQENQVAHDLWTWAEGNILNRLEEARRGKRVDPSVQVGAMTQLGGVADAYQEYAKTGDATDLLEVLDVGFKGKIVNQIVKTVPRDQRGVSAEERAVKVARNEEDRQQYLPIVRQMSREEAITALRWGHIQNSELKTLRRYAAIWHTKYTGTPYKVSLRMFLKETDKQELVDRILSYRHTRGKFTGLPTFRPPGRSYRVKEDKIKSLFGG